MSIGEICLAIISFFELYVIFRMNKINNEQWIRINELKKEKSKMSNSLRLKGNEVTRLMNKVKRLRRTVKDYQGLG